MLISLMKEENMIEKANKIDKLANDMMQKGASIKDLEVALQKYNPDELNIREQESWYHLYGIAAFRANRRADALERFEEGLSKCPESAEIAFSLGQEYEFQGNIQAMLDCFDRANFPDVPASYLLAQVRYCYLWNEYEKAITYLEPILQAYQELEILDDTFLYIRELPFFSLTWGYLACLCVLTDNIPELRRITENYKSFGKDYDFSHIDFFLGCLESGNFDGLIQEWKKSQTKEKKKRSDLSYADLQGAVFESQITDDFKKAEQYLMSVQSGNLEFPWMADVATIALADLMNRKGDTDKEEKFVNTFLLKQPLLFDPDHATYFGLLNYQEILKVIYQEQRRKI
jgi:tetratricopeptide (TPR) repeat protein